MPSQLTRAVFRRLVAEQRLSYSGCLAPGVRTRRRPVLGPRAHFPLRIQSRSFLGLPIFGKRRNAVTEPRLDPGIDKLEEHAKRLRLNARLNDPQEVRHAVRKYVKHKQSIKSYVEDRHVNLLHKAYKYLRRTNNARLDVEELRDLLRVLKEPRGAGQPYDTRDDQVRGRFSVLLLADILERSEGGMAVGQEDVQLCILTLTASGRSMRAREIVFERSLQSSQDDDFGTAQTVATLDIDIARCLPFILRGFSEESNQAEVMRTIDLAAQHGFAVEKMSSCAATLCHHFTKARDTSNAKLWYDHFKTAKLEAATGYSLLKDRASGELHTALIQYCIETGDREWGQTLTTDVLDMVTPKRAYDLILVWAAGTGKGVEEIDRMIGILEESGKFKLNISTINKLIGLALWQKDAYKAERFFNLGIAHGLTPNAATFVMQIDYRCSVNDVDGALTAYSNMQSETYPENGEEVSAVNKLVRAMCATRVHDFDSIMNVAADLTDTGARFDAETVSTLAVLHLSRAEIDDAEDLLNTHAFQYSSAERKGILHALIDFCSNPENDSEVVWATYELLKKTFDDMNRDQRTRLMNEFMRRGHGHLAVSIFEHMRLHTREDTLPIFDTYIQCLKGITELKDDESFNALYNLLKLDTSIEPNTALHNALMEACIACGEAPQALAFWARITASHEGPDILSIKLVMEACQDSPQGDQRAMEIHRRLEAAGFEMKPTYYAWVLAALAAHGKVAVTISLMEQIWERKGVAPSVDMLGSILNVVSSNESQLQFLVWAREKVPSVCDELERFSLGTDVLGRRKYNRMSVKGDEHIKA
ncbi:Hypothetical protein D9617_13g098430 [Elsinoe fawcettii]|nr:Hypothetical protein D9617_13g098430 [Elsinoe fawcettii]